ncbi:hypothetical protein MKX01_041574 [Papaver californicum]|nr:hypothetical protein MKX01_041574 [Papaver californicum]
MKLNIFLISLCLVNFYCIANTNANSLFPHDEKTEFMNNIEKIVEKKLIFPNLTDSFTSSMFYFFFESRINKRRSLANLPFFQENGPFTIVNNDSTTLMWNEFGWDQVSNILYVDQPTGTGFSYSSDERDLPQNEEYISNDLYDFMQSYVGHYIPTFASRVSKGNKTKEGIHLNLKGCAIRNGLTNPIIQYKAYADYALQNKLIRESDYKYINVHLFPESEKTIKLCGTKGDAECREAFSACNFIYYFILRIKFVNMKSVTQALGVGNIENLEVDIPTLLNDGIQFLIYAGEYFRITFLSNIFQISTGNYNWVHAMKWSGKQDFDRAANVSFVVDGAEAGILKNHGPLSFLKVNDAGHMVPMDQPKAALEMLKRWTQGKLTVEAVAPVQTQSHLCCKHVLALKTIPSQNRIL